MNRAGYPHSPRLRPAPDRTCGPASARRLGRVAHTFQCRSPRGGHESSLDPAVSSPIRLATSWPEARYGFTTTQLHRLVWITSNNDGLWILIWRAAGASAGGRSRPGGYGTEPLPRERITRDKTSCSHPNRPCSQ
jgi:hypothetical protein